SKARSAEPQEYEYRVRRASDGEYRWHLGRSMPVVDRHGRVMRRVGVASDIHERKRSEELLREQAAALQASEEQFRTMADGLPLLVWTAAPDGTPMWHNLGWS